MGFGRDKKSISVAKFDKLVQANPELNQVDYDVDDGALSMLFKALQSYSDAIHELSLADSRKAYPLKKGMIELREHNLKEALGDVRLSPRQVKLAFITAGLDSDGSSYWKYCACYDYNKNRILSGLLSELWDVYDGACGIAEERKGAISPAELALQLKSLTSSIYQWACALQAPMLEQLREEMITDVRGKLGQKLEKDKSRSPRVVAPNLDCTRDSNTFRPVEKTIAAFAIGLSAILFGLAECNPDGKGPKEIAPKVETVSSPE